MATAKKPDAPWSTREHVFPKAKPAAKREALETAEEDNEVKKPKKPKKRGW